MRSNTIISARDFVAKLREEEIYSDAYLAGLMTREGVVSDIRTAKDALKWLSTPRDERGSLLSSNTPILEGMLINNGHGVLYRHKKESEFGGSLYIYEGKVGQPTSFIKGLS